MRRGPESATGQDEPAGGPLNVLVLYEASAVRINAVREHVACFGRYSRHRVRYAPATAGQPLTFPLEPFDVVIVHYSVRLSSDRHLSPEFAWALKKYRGLKALFIQDEYDHTRRAAQWIDQLGVRVVFTCVPPEHVRTIYPTIDPARTEFVPTLTGYVPEDADPGKHVRPPAARRVVVGYRGRELPYRYGRLAREKLMIGVRMRAECEARGVPHDIEWAADKRIYGPAWVDFVASCRTTLGTESGANVFDFDGTLATTVEAALAADPTLTYDQVEDRFLRGRETAGVMNQVSPRIFEAVALRTGLILFEGTYSGVVRPDEHFIPLKKDFSNVTDVLRRAQDDRELTAMTDRAYRAVIASGRYAYGEFVRGVDAVLSRLAGRGRGESPAGGVPELPAYSPGPASRLARLRGRPVVGGLITAARNLARGIYRGSGIRAVRLDWRQRRGSAILTRAVPELAAWLRSGPAPDGVGRLKREAARLALLRHTCRDCPTGRAPVWTDVRFDVPPGPVVFRTRPSHDLPGEIVSGQPVVDRVVAAIRARQVREVVWDFRVAGRELVIKMGKLGDVFFDLGPDGTFRFTALARLADQDPERAARLLAAVAVGASAPADGGVRQAV